MSRRYDLVVFDLDGTLADTKKDLADAANFALESLGYPTHPVDHIRQLVGGGLVVLLQRALGPVHGADRDTVEKALKLFIPRYRDHMLDATRPYPGTVETLDRLAKGGVKLAIATNKSRMFTVGIVEALFPARFDPIVACGEDVPRKPDPLCVSRAMERNPGIPKGRILFVGDSIADVDTAAAAGVDVASCTWGFGEREELAARKPRWLLDAMPEVADVALGAKT